MQGNQHSLGTLFQDIARLRIFAYNAMLKDIGLTATQSWVLIALLEEEGVIQGNLARTLGIRAVTLGGVIDRMEAKNWLERRPDENDRRAKRIWLTPKGRKLEKVINKCLTDVHNLAIEDIPAKDVDSLFGTITTIRTNLQRFKSKQDKG
jgi:DNA-binding MarR family transcriptional regulator